MERKEYSGWTNYETWNVALWMDNDQRSNEYWREQASEIYEHTDEAYQGALQEAYGTQAANMRYALKMADAACRLARDAKYAADREWRAEMGRCK